MPYEICDLPDVLIEIIYCYVNPEWLIKTNKIFYDKYHFLLNMRLDKKTRLKNIKNCIYNNYSFVLEYYLYENAKLLSKLKYYKINKTVYRRYFDFLQYYCRHNNSEESSVCVNKFINICNKTNF